LETCQKEESLKRGVTLTKAKARTRRQEGINLPKEEMIQEMIPVVAQKALVEIRVAVTRNLKTIPGRLDNYHQAKKNRNK